MASVLTYGAGETKTWMVVNQVSEDDSVEIAEARDENGKVIEMKAYSSSKEMKYEGLLKAAGTPPEKGTVCEVDGWSGLVTSVSKTKSNTEFVKLSITLKKSDSAELTPLA